MVKVAGNAADVPIQLETHIGRGIYRSEIAEDPVRNYLSPPPAPEGSQS